MANARSEAAKKRRESQAKAKVTSSATRGARSKASSSEAKAKTTSSATRGARVKASSKPNVTASSGGSARTKGGPNKADAQQWQKYNQSAKTSGTGWKGAPGTADAPKNAQPTGGRTAKAQITANKLARKVKLAKQGREAAAAVGKVAKAGKAGIVGAVAAAGLTSRNTADGTLKGKPTGPAKGPAVPERLKQTPKGQSNPYKEGTFNHAFKAARNAGKKEFTWKGQKYTTKVK